MTEAYSRRSGHRPLPVGEPPADVPPGAASDGLAARRSRRQNRQLDMAVLIGPSLLVFAVFFALPMVYLAIVSFWRLRLYRLEPDFTFQNYLLTLTDYPHSIAYTIVIALIIGLLTTTLAYAFAYVIRFKLGRLGEACLFVTLVTLFGGYLVKIYAWKTILGSGGILNSGLLAFGLVDQPVTWFLYSPAAVIVTLVHFLFPFAVLPIYGSLLGVEPRHLEAARDLGAQPRRVFRDIVLPQTRPGLVAAFALTFLYSAGDYVTPRLVGGPNIPMIGNFIESQLIQRLNAPQGAAMAITTMALCCLLVVLAERIARRVLEPR